MLKSPKEAQELEVKQAVKPMEETALRGETTKQGDDAELRKGPKAIQEMEATKTQELEVT